MELPFQGPIKSSLLAARWYAHALERDSFPGVLVLCYHGIRPTGRRTADITFANLHVETEVFDEHCRVLAETCHPISLDTWREARSGKAVLPARPVVVTFDDGYRSVFELARPILQRHQIPATVFVCSNPVREQQLFWFDAVARRRGEAAVEESRTLPHAGWRDVAAACAARADAADPLAPMTPDQVRQLADEGFTIGVHTASHAPLITLPAPAQRDELESCRDAIHAWTGRSVTTLAYPWGKRDADYSGETVTVAAAAGFDEAFTTAPAFSGPGEAPLERSRFVVLSEVSAPELAHRITYTWTR